MIKSIIVMDGVGNFKEIIKDYDFFCALHFDQHLSISERLKRRKNEGFATNLFGTNTGVVGQDRKVGEEEKFLLEEKEFNYSAGVSSKILELKSDIEKLYDYINTTVKDDSIYKNNNIEPAKFINSITIYGADSAYVDDNYNTFSMLFLDEGQGFFMLSTKLKKYNTEIFYNTKISIMINTITELIENTQQNGLQLFEFALDNTQNSGGSSSRTFTQYQMNLIKKTNLLFKKKYDDLITEIKNLYIIIFFGEEYLNDANYDLITKYDVVTTKPVYFYDNFGKTIDDNMNNWLEVKNGELFPKKFEVDEKINTRNFKIPLMLRTIGANKSQQYYKPIPLSVFNGGLRVIITLNPNAFSVYNDIKIDDLKNDYFSIDKIFKFTEVKNEINNGGLHNARKYAIKNLRLSTIQYRFDDRVTSYYMQLLKDGKYFQRYLETTMLDNTYFKQWPTLTYTKNYTLNNITKVQAIILSDVGNYSPYAKHLDRYNRGIKSIVFKQNGAQYPPITLELHNSLSTFGDENSTFFYQELSKGLKYYENENDYFINMVII
jgi:hypothetical protein